jgi:hypothetical protein
MDGLVAEDNRLLIDRDPRHAACGGSGGDDHFLAGGKLLGRAIVERHVDGEPTGESGSALDPAQSCSS